ARRQLHLSTPSTSTIFSPKHVRIKSHTSSPTLSPHSPPAPPASSPPIRAKPRIAVECDSASSLITEVETGCGIAPSSTIFKLVAGRRLLYRPLTGTTEVASVASPEPQTVM